MPAATSLATISRPLGMPGEASDAVSALAHVHMSEVPRLPRLLERGCPHTWKRQSRSRRPTQWGAIQEPVVPPERKLHGHPLAGLLWVRRLEDVLGRNWATVRSWECLHVHRPYHVFLSAYVDGIHIQMTCVERSAEGDRSGRSNMMRVASVYGKLIMKLLKPKQIQLDESPPRRRMRNTTSSKHLCLSVDDSVESRDGSTCRRVRLKIL